MHEFELTDADGNVHRYVVTVHPGREGMHIVAKLAELGAEALGQLATQLAGVDGVLDVLKASVNNDPEANTKLQGVAKSLDLAGAARSLRPLIAASPELVKQLFKYVRRTGAPLPDGSPGAAVSLAEDIWFSQAYQANYGELAAAVAKVVALNRFFPWPATSSGSGRP